MEEASSLRRDFVCTLKVDCSVHAGGGAVGLDPDRDAWNDKEIFSWT